MSQKLDVAIAVIGIDIGKNSFHIVGHDHRGAIVLRQFGAIARPLRAPRCRQDRVRSVVSDLHRSSSADSGAPSLGASSATPMRCCRILLLPGLPAQRSIVNHDAVRRSQQTLCPQARA